MRWVWHGLWALGCAAVAYFLHNGFPSLADDTQSVFAYVAGWVTVFGIFVALIEVARAQNSAERASKAAKQAQTAVESLYKQRDLSECRISIENALRSIDENRSVSVSVLGRIVYIYASRFAREYALEASDVRKHCLLVEGYYVSETGNANRGTKQLQKALVGMSAKIGAENSVLSEGIEQ